ncbi:MAG: group 1 glycosyl transferase, partial [Candidatus Omnitrophica bacterium]|nr:group 1 glycosyl transferase [Candidatus Omnitrophota bacterium]
IGKSGVVTPMYNPEATAGAVLAILRDPDLRARMGRAGQKRVNTYYRSEDLFAGYHELYYKYSQEL